MTRETLEVLADSADLFEKKEADYGQSWKLVGQILAMILDHQDVETLEIPVDADSLNQLGLFFRRGDKFCRQFNGMFALDEMNVDENLVETHEDSVNYAAMATELAENIGEQDPSSESADDDNNGRGHMIGGEQFHFISMRSEHGMNDVVSLRCSRTGVEIMGNKSDVMEMADD